MGKKKNIKIPLPDWKWWQTGIVLIMVILAFRIDATPAMELLKMWLKSYVAQ